MGLAEELERLREGLAAGRTIILVGRMTAVYKGRSSSYLTEGERILIVKSDRTVLLHRPTGRDPVNWQPPGSQIRTQLTDDALVIEFKRVSPSELLRVSVSEVKSLGVYSLIDEGEFTMHATEEEMKAAILLEPEILEKGFRPLESERRVRDEYIDILGMDAEGRMVIVEIKRRSATRRDVEQAARYASLLREELGSTPRVILVAPSIQRDASSAASLLKVEYRCLSPRTAYEVLKRSGGLAMHL